MENHLLSLVNTSQSLIQQASLAVQNVDNTLDVDKMFPSFMSLCLLERVNSECAKVAVIFEEVEVAASFCFSCFILIGKTNISRSGQLKIYFPRPD